MFSWKHWGSQSKSKAVVPVSPCSEAAMDVEEITRNAEELLEDFVPAVAAYGLSADVIARRAFDIWERKGRPTDMDLENWIEAEVELQ